MKMIIALLFLFSHQSQSAEDYKILCDLSMCRQSQNLTTSLSMDSSKGFFDIINRKNLLCEDWIGCTGDDLDVTLTGSSSIRKIVTIINTINLDLNFNLSADPVSGLKSSGGALVITPLAHDLNLTSDGKSGRDGLSSKQLCSQAMNKECNSSFLLDSFNYGFDCKSVSSDPTIQEWTTGRYYVGGILNDSKIIKFTRQYLFKDCLNIFNGIHKYIARDSYCGADYLDLGLAPDPSNYTYETVECDFDKNCDITSEKLEVTKSLASTFHPTPGEDKVAAGSIDVFLYLFNNVKASNFVGSPGKGGEADLVKVLGLPLGTPMPESTRYCYKLNGNSNFLSLIKVHWKPFSEAASAGDGSVGTIPDGVTSVVKGLDSTMRYWLSNDNSN